MLITSYNCGSFLLQDLPLGLMDDIYEWSKNFSIRIDEVEEVCRSKCNQIQSRIVLDSIKYITKMWYLS